MSDTGNIVVTSTQIFDQKVFAGFANFRNTSYNYETEMSPEGAGCGENRFINLIEHITQIVLEKIFDKAVRTSEQIEDDQRKIAQEFDPGNVAARSTYRTFVGREGFVWSMTDGTSYWDTNGDGQPDYHTKFNDNGELWGNTGSGWTLLQ